MKVLVSVKRIVDYNVKEVVGVGGLPGARSAGNLVTGIGLFEVRDEMNLLWFSCSTRLGDAQMKNSRSRKPDNHLGVDIAAGISQRFA